MLGSIKKLQLRWSDLLLIPWVVFGILICVEQNRFMSDSYGALLEFQQPFFLCVIYFVIMTIFIVLFLVFEYKRCPLKNPIIIGLLFFILLLSQIETIFLAPNYIKMYIYDHLRGHPDTINVYLNTQVKFIHFFKIYFSLVSVFVAVFILPKKIKNIKLFNYFIYFIYLVAIPLLIYSLVKDDYIYVFKVLFLKEESELPLKDICPSCIFGSPNTFGLFLEMVVFASLINYSIDKRKINLVFSIIFYLFLLCTICMGGIIAATISLFILLIVLLVKSITSNNKRLTIRYLITMASIISLLLIFIIVTKVTGAYDSLFGKFVDFTGRDNIWYASLTIISNTSYCYGAGYGIYNTLISHASSRYSLYNSPVTHNSFLALIGMGGLLFVVPYIVLIIYALYLFIRKSLSNKTIAPLGCLLISLMIHSMLEDVFYYVIMVCVVIMTVNNIDKNKTNRVLD